MAKTPRAPRVPEVEPEGLSKQQREIWRLARQGKTVGEIAASLQTSQQTIRIQLNRIRIKKSVNKKTLTVKRVLETLSQSLPADLTKQETVELLTRAGNFPARAIAEQIGSTPGAVRVMKARSKKMCR